MTESSATTGVSICIVNWNGRELLWRLLESIREHAAEVPSQVIVVDNASADGSAEMVAGEYPEVVLVRNESNRGFASGNNQAAERAMHPLLFFLNNDTALRAGVLERLVGVIEENTDMEGRRRVVAAGPRLIGSDGLPQHTARRLPTLAALLHRVLWLRWTGLFKRAYRRYRMGDFDPGRSGRVDQLDAAALLVRREAFERAGRWDEGFVFGMEDVDLCARLGQIGAIWYVAEAEMDHSGRVSSRANRPFVYRGYECGYARYVRKQFGAGPAIVYKLLITLDMPVRVVVLGGQYAAHRVFRGQERAARARQRLVAAGAFLFTGLPDLWRA